MKGKLIMKIKQKAICLISVIVLLLSLSTIGLAIDNTSNNSTSPASSEVIAPFRYTAADEATYYPINPNTPEWSTMQTSDELIAACRISEDALKNMTTEEVVDAVLSFPLIIDLYAYNNLDTALKHLSTISDAYRELLTRDDAAHILSQALISAHSVESESTSKLPSYTIEILLSDQRLMGSDKEANYWESYPYATRAYTTTPNGTSVEVIYTGEQFDSATRDEIDEEFRNRYPQATLMESSTTRYNCHNFAWNSQSPRGYCMNNPFPYMSDGSYTKTKTPVAMAKIYYEGEHSGIISPSYTGGPFVPTVFSKWGSGPLVQHRENYSPYSGSISYWEPAN